MKQHLALLALLVAPVLHAQEAQHPWQGRGLPRHGRVVRRRAGNRALAVAMVGMTVGDMDRSVKFYTSVLDFRVVSDDEAGGASYDSLQGLRERAYGSYGSSSATSISSSPST